MTRSGVRLSLGGAWLGAVLAGVGVFLFASGAASTPASVNEEQEVPTFRSAVDVVAVDVQVVDPNGTPIGALDATDFEVSIGGRRRRVVSADHVRFTSVDGTPFRAGALGPVASNSRVAADRPARVYILAFDVGTLGVGDSRAIVGAALTFIDRLLPADRVGLYTFPVGPETDPTTDHALVRRLVQTVRGSRTSSEGFDSRFNLSPSEVIDIMAESVRSSPFATVGRGGRGQITWEDAMTPDEVDTIRAVMIRECGAAEMRCGDEIRAEATSRAYSLQAQGIANINGIRALVRMVSTYEGRKTVVMFTSGMPTSDRPGGSPDLGGLPMALGKDAAATNTAIYTVHVDSTQQRAIGAGTGRASGAASTRSRDRAVESRVLEEFADASGGAMFTLQTGAGEHALERVLRETSSHYLLGVEPQASDRDGSLRRLTVKVKRSGVTVRSREWVTVPKS